MHHNVDGSDLAATFRSINSRTSRLTGLQNALHLAGAYGYSAGSLRAISRLIAKEQKSPRPVGMPARKARAKQKASK